MSYIFGPFPAEYRPRPARDGDYSEMVRGQVSVEIDSAAVARLLGGRALRSKRGLAIEIGGLVKVRRVS